MFGIFVLLRKNPVASMSVFNPHSFCTCRGLEKKALQEAAASCRNAEHLPKPLNSGIGKVVTVVIAQVSISLL